MGWQGYKSSIDVGMIFKKMYCGKCGTRLRVEKNTEIIEKGDDRFSNRMPGKVWAIGMSSYRYVTYIYCCPNCGAETTYDEQCIVSKKQKRLKKIILDEND